MYFLGLDIGSSSVKLAVINGETGERVVGATYPPQEMTISAPQSGWAEQSPEAWWDAVRQGCAQMWAEHPEAKDKIGAIGISYQMHGLVAVDAQGEVLRPSIIWCDSRAVATGEKAFEELGKDWCMEHLLNSPGNFTAAKLRWVQENEPDTYAKIDKILLPGDYIAYKLSGECTTTAGTSGVVYAVTDKNIADPDQRINTFRHVNKGEAEVHKGLLACINGAGRMNSWLRGVLSAGGEVSYPKLNELGESVEPGSEGLNVYPFGNGAERIMRNKLLSAQMDGLDLNRHSVNHIARATQEGVAYAMNLGFDLIKGLGAETRVVRAGHSNMFLSPIFSSAFVNLTGAPLELYQTDSAEGVARAAAWGCDYYTSREDVFRTLTRKAILEPEAALQSRYQELYGHWREAVERRLAEAR